MFHRAATTSLIIALVFTSVRAQDLVDPETPDAIVERYLQLHALDELRAVQLRQRLARGGTAPERLAIAERLGDIYAALLEQPISSAERRDIERRSKELLDSIPGLDSFALRIRLAKAQYLQAERIAERWRLRLTTDEDAIEARRTLQEVQRTFSLIGSQAASRITQLTNQERRADDPERTNIRAQITAAQADRSSAMYYAGWSGYWFALMANDKGAANRAAHDLGTLLGADGKMPEIILLDTALLSYEHVARAAMAIAMSHSIEGSDSTALLWFKRLAAAPDLHESVRDQLFSRESWVIARAKRWEELHSYIDSRRKSSGGPLTVLEARLVAIISMEGSASASQRDTEFQSQIAADAIADLIAQGEVAHVLDLLRRYGTLPVVGDGFIVRYARGLLAYDLARRAHRESAEDESQPTRRADVAAKYKEATDLLAPAFDAVDSSRFASERARCALTVGLTHYYRARYSDAARWCEQAAALSPDPKQREESLWLALVALDRAVAESANEEARQWASRLTVVYMREFPETERAAILLLRSENLDDIEGPKAIEVLSAVPTSSPLYDSARRHLGRLLYREYRRATPDRRDAEAARFLAVAEELLELDAAIVVSGSREQAIEASQAVIVRVRQILDVVLSSRAPELTRADRALELLERVANQMGLGLGEIDAELAYRRLQIALFRSDEPQIEEQLSRLTRTAGRFARAADRLLYRHYLDRWSRPDASQSEARNLIRFGGRILATPDDDSDRLNADTLLSVADRVSEAAEALWTDHDDLAMRALALRIAQQWFERGKWTESTLRRVARLAELEGDKTTAFEAWNTLSAAYRTGEESWFEARYNSMRLLVELDPDAARTVVSQHVVLYPSFGPPPWDEKIRALSARLELLPRITIPGGTQP